MYERDYQAKLIKKLRLLFPGCFILKNDSGYLQGVPDLTILYWEHWAVLEVKLSEDEPYQPNQEFYLDQLGRMSFSATIFPENEEEVLHELQLAFKRSGRESRNT